MRARLTARSVTLTELIVAMVLFATMALGFYSIDIFTRSHILVSKRLALLQDELSRIILHMSRYVQEGIGFADDPPMQCKSVCGMSATGFSVRVDCADIHTPDDFGNDTLVVYTLTGNTLSATCRNNSDGGNCPQSFSGANYCIPLSEVLSTHMVSGCWGNIPLASSGQNLGLYYRFSDANSVIYVRLQARWDPNLAESADNPQVTMVATLYARSASAR